jgi:hypothetical protein
MASEFGKRRAEIMSFLKGLSERERLVVLTCICNDPTISARIPNLARAVLEMHRAYHKNELLKLVEAEHSNVDLEFLARRKGCRLQRVAGSSDRWCIRWVQANLARSRTEGQCQQNSALTLVEALDTLRALPDWKSAAKA